MDKIYTRNGDEGYTSNLLNKKCYKGDIEIELQGEMDEVNAQMGFLRSLVKASVKEHDNSSLNHIDSILKKIQYHLYLLGIEISTEFTEIHISEDEVKFLEREIDYLLDNTVPIKTFIYYSGSKTSTFSHVIRTAVRKSERTFVRLLENKKYPISYKYINRLSDYFFALSRYLNDLEGIEDEVLNHAGGK